jgi:uncharacterized protein YunC (DUF1805 family)
MDLNGFSTCRHELKRPLLIISGSRGSLACGYLNVETFEELDEAVAVVRGVNDFEDMCTAQVQAVSSAAQRLGVRPGMTGEEALGLMQ